MAMSKVFISLLILTQGIFEISAQSFTSYFTGDIADVETNSLRGICLMGGASEHDNAMIWFLERAGEGDVLVLRASGSDGYNDYMFSDLGVVVNSVETIVFNSASAATDPYVIEQVQNAEAIWFAGGDQWDYISYWKNNAIEDAINNLIHIKGGPVGGISAGMAIMGAAYFSAENGSVTTAQALANPYASQVQIGYSDFIDAPYLEDVITDTHYDDPDRRGRHFTFLARLFQDEDILAKGIACDEYSAVCIDESGIARVFGDAPQNDDFVYFLRPNCIEPIGPELCAANQPLTWDRNNAALKVYRINANSEGEYTFNLNNWTEGTGGTWQDWYAVDGVMQITPDTDSPDCTLDIQKENPKNFNLFPIPANDYLTIDGVEGLVNIEIFNIMGQIQFSEVIAMPCKLNISKLDSGIYVVRLGGDSRTIVLE